MRLLNTATLALESFSETPPPYAILSHTWGQDEVLFEDIRNGTARQRKAFPKVEKCCRLAADQGYAYAWIDTCCIDKSSSAELSEAINSMFNWYRDSAVAYAYLEDLTIGKPKYAVKELKDCRWFGRGWTLQELIAPKTLQFYDGNWDGFGTRHELSQSLSRVTGINSLILLDGGDIAARLLQFSVYQRFSWASRRETTRPEDMAYSLMGIFDVNLPLLYGEGGKKAFFRLQEEILKYSMDQSILAWMPLFENVSRTEMTGVLADSVTRFTDKFPVVPFRLDDDRPYHMTNKGLSMTVPVILGSDLLKKRSNAQRKPPRALALSTNTVIAVLSCHLQDSPIAIIGIPLAPLNLEADPLTTETFGRWDTTLCPLYDGEMQDIVPRTIYISHSRGGRVINCKEITFFVSYSWYWKLEAFLDMADKPAVDVLQAIPADGWMPGRQVFQMSPRAGEAAKGAALMTVFGHHNKVVMSFRASGTDAQDFIVLLDPEETEEAGWLIDDDQKDMNLAAEKEFPDGAILLAQIETCERMGRVVKEVSVTAYQTREDMEDMMCSIRRGEKVDGYICTGPTS
ncbi:uncharacterized protein DNG_09140 [Cephalotrichum gorgonifer]|uniref:HET domain-containing protein n=1 Tax=Cephalotrichum gorgonifer TaxID=2041049 RepID=A0AAE8SZ05_9PEZI|nr:uncharacterized protein DNG_09140 [Cephalotrichum gorgonifer]